jgi:hypothetical protein
MRTGDAFGNIVAVTKIQANRQGQESGDPETTLEKRGTMLTQRPSLVGLALALLVLFSTATVWAQSTGNIAGLVTDESGAVLPGVTIEASSPALIEGVRTVVSDGAVASG